jgi:hypothetical protein
MFLLATAVLKILKTPWLKHILSRSDFLRPQPSGRMFNAIHPLLLIRELPDFSWLPSVISVYRIPVR